MGAKRVFHPVYKMGAVLEQRRNGFESQVRFDNGRILWVRTDRLQQLQESGAQQKVLVAPKKSLSSSKDKKPAGSARFISQKLIEMLRMGIVPLDEVESFTFGRARETKKVEEWLASQGIPSLAMVGSYGSGKSHMLHYVKGQALKLGYAVADLEINPNETPFSKPKRVYQKLVASLQYISPSTKQLSGFRTLISEAINKGGFKEHRYFRHAGEQSDTIWEWLEAAGSPPRPDFWGASGTYPPMYDYGTAGNIYCNLLSAIGNACREQVGLNGLLLIFDEAEFFTTYWYSYELDKTLNFLSSLLRAAADEEALLGHPAASGLQYCSMGDAGRLPFLSASPSGLKIVLAFTDAVDLRRVAEIEEAEKIFLKPLGDGVLEAVFNKIASLYEQAYSKSFSPGIHANLFNRVRSATQSTRQFVKASVEAFDIHAFHNAWPT